MRKIIASIFVSLDGVMQAPGGPEEDPTGGFQYGGWATTFWDDTLGETVAKVMDAPFDLLLGRRTYDIFAAHWPFVECDPSKSAFEAQNAEIAERFNGITKYVATHRPDSLTWRNSQGLGDNPVAALRKIKAEDGPNLLVQGSSELLRLLLANDLIDELTLLIFPIVFGKGKRWFDDSAAPARFAAVSHAPSPNGVSIVGYRREGEITTGSFAMENPAPEEIERRRSLGD